MMLRHSYSSFSKTSRFRRKRHTPTKQRRFFNFKFSPHNRLLKLRNMARIAYDNYYTPKSFDEFDVVYRTDSRNIDSLEDGFKSRGDNTNLLTYVRRNVPSRYISTSKTEEAALNFARHCQSLSLNSDKFYIYEITGIKKGVDVESFLYFSCPFPDQEEVAVVGNIPRAQIRRYRQINEDGTLEPWINNSHYKDSTP